MKYIRSNFFKSFIILASGSLIAQLVTALVSPAMTRLFTTTSIGEYTYVLSVVNLFYPVIALQYDYMIVTEKDEDKVFALLKLSFILLIISTVLITVGYLMINFHQKKVGLIAVILSIMMLSNGFVDIIGNYNNRYKQYSLISETYITRSLAQNLLMLLAGYFKLGIIGLLLSQAIGSLVGLKKQSSLLIKERKKVVTSSFSKMKEVMIKYRNQALYTTPAVFMGSFSYNALNIFIAQFYGNSILGLYSMSYRILGMPVNLVSNNLAKVFYEEAAREYESKGSFFNSWRIVKLSATVCQKILHMGFHSLTLCEDVDLTAFGSVQRPVLYNYQYLFAWENIPGLIHLYSHLFHAVQANMDRANRQ